MRVAGELRFEGDVPTLKAKVGTVASTVAIYFITPQAESAHLQVMNHNLCLQRKPHYFVSWDTATNCMTHEDCLILAG